MPLGRAGSPQDVAEAVLFLLDDDRAAYLMECLRRLRGSISQILLVTHKQFEADNTISLMRRK